MNNEWISGFLRIAAFIATFYFGLTCVFEFIDGVKINFVDLLKESLILGMLLSLVLNFLRRLSGKDKAEETEGEKQVLNKVVVIDFVVKMVFFVAILTLTSTILDTVNEERVNWLETIKESIFISFVVMVVLNFSGRKKSNTEK